MTGHIQADMPFFVVIQSFSEFDYFRKYCKNLSLRLAFYPYIMLYLSGGTDLDGCDTSGYINPGGFNFSSPNSWHSSISFLQRSHRLYFFIGKPDLVRLQN